MVCSVPQQTPRETQSWVLSNTAMHRNKPTTPQASLLGGRAAPWPRFAAKNSKMPDPNGENSTVVIRRNIWNSWILVCNTEEKGDVIICVIITIFLLCVGVRTVVIIVWIITLCHSRFLRCVNLLWANFHNMQTNKFWSITNKYTAGSLLCWSLPHISSIWAEPLLLYNDLSLSPTSTHSLAQSVFLMIRWINCSCTDLWTFSVVMEEGPERDIPQILDSDCSTHNLSQCLRSPWWP